MMILFLISSPVKLGSWIFRQHVKALSIQKVYDLISCNNFILLINTRKTLSSLNYYFELIFPFLVKLTTTEKMKGWCSYRKSYIKMRLKVITTFWKTQTDKIAICKIAWDCIKWDFETSWYQKLLISSTVVYRIMC